MSNERLSTILQKHLEDTVNSLDPYIQAIHTKEDIKKKALETILDMILDLEGTHRALHQSLKEWLWYLYLDDSESQQDSEDYFWDQIHYLIRRTLDVPDGKGLQLSLNL